jgi:hypothetical protein
MPTGRSGSARTKARLLETSQDTIVVIRKAKPPWTRSASSLKLIMPWKPRFSATNKHVGRPPVPADAAI